MAKGGSMEREVCSILSRWWTNDKRDDIFYRSNSSGGRFTQRKKTGKDTANQGGDVTFTDSIGESLIKVWNIEVKTGYGGKIVVKDKSGKTLKKIQTRWDILDLMDSHQKASVFEQMWEQCIRDAGLTCRIPILIFRRNQRSICIAMESGYVTKLMEHYGKPKFKKITYIDEKRKMSVVIFLLKDFLDWAHNFDKFFL